MTDDLMPFESLAEMRDAVLEAQPSGPGATKLAGETRESVIRSVDAIRQDNCFEFGAFDLDTKIFYEIAKQGEHAFVAGLLGLPCPVFAGLAALMAGGISVPTIVMAEEVPRAEHALPTDDPTPVLYVHAVQPMRWTDGGFEFLEVFSALLVWVDEGHLVCRPMGLPIDEFETKRSSRDGAPAIPEIPLWTLFVMLSLLADDRSTISRTVAPVNVNEARARRGLAPIPPLWTVGRGGLVEPKLPCS